MYIREKQIDFYGNPEHLDIIMSACEKQDVSLWNEWRQAHPSVQPDLKGVDISRDTVDGFKLESLNMSEADLEGGIFKWNTFNGSNFSKANCKNGDLFETYFQKVDFSNVCLSGCNMISARLNQSNLNQANVIDSVLMHTDLTGTCITGLAIYRAHLFHCIINTTECDYLYIDDDRKERYPKERALLSDELPGIFSGHSMMNEEFLEKLPK